MEIKIIEEIKQPSKQPLRTLYRKDVMMILDGVLGLIKNLICNLADEENGILLAPLKVDLYLNLYRYLEGLIKCYDKELNGIYNPEYKKPLNK